MAHGSPAKPVVQAIAAEQAQALVAAGRVRILDVRTPEEYDRLGHIPDAWLLPVDLIACAPAVLDARQPWLVCCEHGVRSAHAAAVLAQAGFAEVLDLTGGMAVWRGPREHGPGDVRGPSPWLLECADLLPRGGRALDVACGRGRHALLLAAAGFEVRAVDRDREALAELAATADRLGLPVACEALDLEDGAADLAGRLGRDAWDLVLVTHYLHRPLFPMWAEVLAPGGVLLYETFTEAQAQRGRPRDPQHLLRAGELPAQLAGLRLLRSFEGASQGRDVAAVAAVKDA